MTPEDAEYQAEIKDIFQQHMRWLENSQKESQASRDKHRRWLENFRESGNLPNLNANDANPSRVIVNKLYLGNINDIFYYLPLPIDINIKNRFHDLATIFNNLVPQILIDNKVSLLALDSILVGACGYEIHAKYSEQKEKTTKQILDFLNTRTDLIDGSIDFSPEQVLRNRLIDFVAIIPSLKINAQVLTWLNNQDQAQQDYSDFFKIFLKAIIKRGPKAVINNIRELITAIIPTVIKDYGESEKQLGISKLTYLTSALLESYIDILSENKEVNVSMKYIYDDAVFGVKKLKTEESSENFIPTLNTFAALFDSLPNDLYSTDEKNNLKNTFLNEFINKIPENQTENKSNYKKYLIPFIIFTSGWTIFTTILYKKQGLPKSLQQFISKKIQRIKSER